MVDEVLLVFAHGPHPFMETTLPSSQVGVGIYPTLDDVVRSPQDAVWVNAQKFIMFMK